jgi:glutamate dehydrogenase
MPTKSDADTHAGLSPSFVQAWKRSTRSSRWRPSCSPRCRCSVRRHVAGPVPAGRHGAPAAGIDTLERGLKLPATSKSQEQLRNYAMQALRRTQQRLLLQVLERTKQRRHAGCRA